MILKYNEIENDNLVEYKKKKIDIKIFKPKDFNEYKKNVEDNGGKVTVVRNTSFKKCKDDNDEYIEIQDKKFKLKDEKARSAKGYIPVGEDRFVRIESWLLLWIFLIGILIVGLLFGIHAIPSKPDNPNSPIDMEDGNDWDGKQDTGNNSTQSQESTKIPGYSNITATKESGIVKLYNLPENTVNFVYTITEQESSEEVKTFDTVEDAQEYINSNNKTYTNYYDEASKKYELKDESGNVTDELIEYKATKKDDGTYTVNKVVSKVIYFTKGIAPNKYVEWDVSKFFDTGVHNVQFRISTYDVDTNIACYGATVNVTITIK